MTRVKSIRCFLGLCRLTKLKTIQTFSEPWIITRSKKNAYLAAGSWKISFRFQCLPELGHQVQYLADLIRGTFMRRQRRIRPPLQPTSLASEDAYLAGEKSSAAKASGSRAAKQSDRPTDAG
ncbi:hypothetical protein KFK09_022259 [Dendrobium nobile]|uniref:Uncharacterized protein n=1 Tax=Dendrobium nobile TaxID=94219 RepID=A0A8T3AJI4_DENNO|nr:hypothetical protein KFK09_022259 [Dendrobium nobile]